MPESDSELPESNLDAERIEKQAAEQAPVEEAGGGESEGFEKAEEQLIERAEGQAGEGDPVGDRFPAEEEDPEAHTIHGEADEVDSSATDDEPGT